MGFLFNGTHSDAYSLVVKTKRQILPDNDDRYVEIPGRDGSYLVGGKAKDKMFSLKCQLEFDSLEALRTLAKNIADWLYTENRAELVFDDEPSVTYMAKVAGAIDVEAAFAYGEFGITFRCHPFGSQAAVSQDITANNIVMRVGSAPALPVITANFTQAAAEYKILHSETGKFVRVVKNFAIADQLVIDHNVARVALNGIGIMTDLDLNSDFFELDRITNTFAITPAGVATSILKYNPRWR